MHLNWLLQFSATVLMILSRGTFRDTLNAKKHLLRPKCVKLMVWFHDKLGKTPKTKEQTLTFLYTVLPTWEQVVNSSKCSTVPCLNFWIRQSITGFLSKNISEDIRNTPSKNRQSFHNPAGMWLAKFFFFVLASKCVCHQQSEIK